MRNSLLYCIAIILFATVSATAQDSYNDRVKKYIDQYYALAIAEQKTAGIPASITLAQGVLETEAGASELMTMANNHFGIKCGSAWNGDTFIHSDDAPNECFKKYKCAADSYKDHSEHLKRNPRYIPLFALSKTDYASWAIGLKQCGYATNPQYAQKLIKIIEDYRLQEYTYTALDTALSDHLPTIAEVKQPQQPDKTVAIDTLDAEEDTDIVVVKQPQAVPVHKTDTVKKAVVKAAVVPAAPQQNVSVIKNMADSAKKVIAKTAPAAALQAKADTNKAVHPAPATVQVLVPNTDSKYDSGKVVMVNGMKAFYAYKDEMLLQYAVKYNVRYARLLEMNDLADAPLPFNMYVYLEKKLTSGTHEKHTVKDGETMLMISQSEGLQMKRLMSLNYMTPGEEPATGAVLELQHQAPRKPDTKLNTIVAHKKNAIASGADTMGVTQNNDYIDINKPQPADTDEDGNKVTAVTSEPAVATPYIAGTDYKGNFNETPEQEAKRKKAEDLANLKSQLDKVVYADDSNLPETKTEAKPEPKTEAKTTAITAKKPVPETKPVNKKGDKYYLVKKGDTAFGIAKKNNITVKQLTKWNDVEPDEIRAGQNLRVKE